MERGDLPDLASGAEARDAEPRDARLAGDALPAVTLFICTSCRRSGPGGDLLEEGETLAQAASAAAPPAGVAVRGVRCLANCKRGLSAAMVRRDGWSYVFGALAADAAADLLEGARLLAAAPDGLMPWRGRPECLKRGMIARVPPLPLSEETR